MENNITEGSKLIAEYLGWKYIPSNDLQGFPKAGWYKDISTLKYFPKSGRVQIENGSAEFVCRKHHELRFYNSMDALLPVIKKLEKEGGFDFDFTLYNNGGSVDDGFTTIAYSFDKNKTWVQNTFDVVVKAIKYISEAHD